MAVPFELPSEPADEEARRDVDDSDLRSSLEEAMRAVEDQRRRQLSGDDDPRAEDDGWADVGKLAAVAPLPVEVDDPALHASSDDADLAAILREALAATPSEETAASGVAVVPPPLGLGLPLPAVGGAEDVTDDDVTGPLHLAALDAAKAAADEAGADESGADEVTAVADEVTIPEASVGAVATDAPVSDASTEASPDGDAATTAAVTDGVSVVGDAAASAEVAADPVAAGPDDAVVATAGQAGAAGGGRIGRHAAATLDDEDDDEAQRPAPGWQPVGANGRPMPLPPNPFGPKKPSAPAPNAALEPPTPGFGSPFGAGGAAAGLSTGGGMVPLAGRAFPAPGAPATPGASRPGLPGAGSLSSLLGTGADVPTTARTGDTVGRHAAGRSDTPAADAPAHRGDGPAHRSDVPSHRSGASDPGAPGSRPRPGGPGADAVRQAAEVPVVAWQPSDDDILPARRASGGLQLNLGKRSSAPRTGGGRLALRRRPATDAAPAALTGAVPGGDVPGGVVAGGVPAGGAPSAAGALTSPGVPVGAPPAVSGDGAGANGRRSRLRPGKAERPAKAGSSPKQPKPERGKAEKTKPAKAAKPAKPAKPAKAAKPIEHGGAEKVPFLSVPPYLKKLGRGR